MAPHRQGSQEERAKMSFVVTVLFEGDPKRANSVLRENPELDEAVRKGIFEHGCVRTTRLIGDGEFLDIDEWRSEEDRDAFVAAAGPQLKRWTELAGITSIESKTWRVALPEEDF
jgi:hypothetical protein